MQGQLVTAGGRLPAGTGPSRLPDGAPAGAAGARASGTACPPALQPAPQSADMAADVEAKESEPERVCPLNCQHACLMNSDS